MPYSSETKYIFDHPLRPAYLRIHQFIYFPLSGRNKRIYFPLFGAKICGGMFYKTSNESNLVFLFLYSHLIALIAFLG